MSDGAAPGFHTWLHPLVSSLKSPPGLGPTPRCPDFPGLGLETKQGSFLENRGPTLLLPHSGEL